MKKATPKKGLAAQMFDAHPFAELVPGGLTEDEHAALVEDIKANGVRMPIVLYQGKILDGRARYRAAQQCGADCPTEELEGFTDEDARNYVMSTNLHRRTLTGMQKALAVAELYKRAVNSDGPKPSQEVMAKRYGVSKQTINLCVKALDGNNAMLLTRMRRGEVTRGELEEEFYDREHANAAVPAGSAGEDDASDLLGGAPLPSNVVPLRGGTQPSMPAAGKRNTHPERRASETPAQAVANQFKALSEKERCDFVALVYPYLKVPFEAYKITGDKATKQQPAKRRKSA